MTNPTSPQLEHGHTRIANALLEALMKVSLGGGEFRVLLAVVRLTYGWRRKSAQISSRQLARATGLSVRHVKRALGALIEAGVLLRERSGRRNVLGLNKHHWQWSISTTSAHGDSAGTSQVTPPVTCGGDETVTPKNKENNKDIVVKKAPVSVHKFLEDSLRRPLNHDERLTATQLSELLPEQLRALSKRMCESRAPAL